MGHELRHVPAFVTGYSAVFTINTAVRASSLCALYCECGQQGDTFFVQSFFLVHDASLRLNVLSCCCAGS